MTVMVSNSQLSDLLIMAVVLMNLDEPSESYIAHEGLNGRTGLEPTGKLQDGGSIPPSSTNFEAGPTRPQDALYQLAAGLTQLVEYQPSKLADRVRIPGSAPHFLEV